MDLTELAHVVGDDNIEQSAGALRTFLENEPGLLPAVPYAVVKPGNVEEVQQVIVWANRTRTPLVPVSSGGPHRRGDTAPEIEGSIIMDLSRMNRIVRIDTVNKLALIEPGVTFGQLIEALEKEDLVSYLPLAPRQTKSVIGSVLEREPVMTPAHHWDSTDPLLCAEVVFGTGDRFRTGEASGPETTEEQWDLGRVQMNPFGHSHVDFQRLLAGAQGTMGIVTWMTVKCGSRANIAREYLTFSDNLSPLLDLMYWLTRHRLGRKVFILNNVNLACLLGKDASNIRRRLVNLQQWALYAGFEGYGVLPQEKIDYESQDFLEAAAGLGLKPELADPELPELLSGTAPEPYWKSRLAGDCDDIFFQTTLDRTPEFVRLVREEVGKYGQSAENTGIYIQPVVQGTSCHCEFNLYHEPGLTREEPVHSVCESVAAAGGFFYRPYAAWRDIAYRRASGTATMQRKLKNIFDPHGILNPGKLCFDVSWHEEARA